MKVRFTDVGAQRKSWEAELSELSDVKLFESIRRNGALMSRGVEFSEDEPGKGTIYVGGFRPVGKWELVEETSHA